ncbi:10579_t:CDS:2, partial [Entrophospora sp. SA101]
KEVAFNDVKILKESGSINSPVYEISTKKNPKLIKNLKIYIEADSKERQINQENVGPIDLYFKDEQEFKKQLQLTRENSLSSETKTINKSEEKKSSPYLNLCF